MGKEEIRVVHVPRWLTVVAWVALSAGMAASEFFLSGHAYTRDTPAAGVMATLRRYDAGSATNSAVIAAMAPVIADILFFVPWGALAFLSLDSEARPRKTTYAATIALGLAFALGLTAAQQMLPARITGGFDALWNAAGCACGAALAHARKRVRVRFD